MASRENSPTTDLPLTDLRDRAAHWRFLAERGLPDRVAREVAALANQLELEAARRELPPEASHS
jgi:hypothetical protein